MEHDLQIKLNCARIMNLSSSGLVLFPEVLTQISQPDGTIPNGWSFLRVMSLPARQETLEA